jgi:hypothetical protein
VVAENDRSEILLACMRDLLEHDKADRALDLARAMAEVIRQQQEFVRLIQKLLEGTPVERAEMQAALEKERARRNRDGAAVRCDCIAEANSYLTSRRMTARSYPSLGVG